MVLLLENALCTLCLRGWGFHAMLSLDCNILQGDSITKLLGLLSSKSNSGRRCTCTVLLVCEGEVEGVSSAWRHVKTALRFALCDWW